MTNEDQYGSINNIDDYIERRFELNEWMARNSKARIILYVNVLLDKLDMVDTVIESEEELQDIIDSLTEPPLKELECGEQEEEEDNE